MLGKTLDELFNDIQRYNNVCECLNQFDDKKYLSIYIDESHIYRGESFVYFYDSMKKEYNKDFIDKILNHIWCGQVHKEFMFLKTIHKIEIYIVDKLVD